MRQILESPSCDDFCGFCCAREADDPGWLATLDLEDPATYESRIESKSTIQETIEGLLRPEAKSLMSNSPNDLRIHSWMDRISDYDDFDDSISTSHQDHIHMSFGDHEDMRPTFTSEESQDHFSTTISNDPLFEVVDDESDGDFADESINDNAAFSIISDSSGSDLTIRPVLESKQGEVQGMDQSQGDTHLPEGTKDCLESSIVSMNVGDFSDEEDKIDQENREDKEDNEEKTSDKINLADEIDTQISLVDEDRTKQITATRNALDNNQDQDEKAMSQPQIYPKVDVASHLDCEDLRSAKTAALQGRSPSVARVSGDVESTTTQPNDAESKKSNDDMLTFTAYNSGIALSSSTQSCLPSNSVDTQASDSSEQLKQAHEDTTKLLADIVDTVKESCGEITQDSARQHSGITPPENTTPRIAVGTNSNANQATTPSRSKSTDKGARHKKAKPRAEIDESLPEESKVNPRPPRIERRKKCPRALPLSPSTFLDQQWEEATVATSTLSTGSQKLLRGGVLLPWRDLHEDLLSYFSKKGKSRALHHLLDSGCNPGTRSHPRPAPLLHAIKGRSMRHVKCVRALLEHGTDINAVSRGRSPLHHAIENEEFEGYKKLLKVLIDAGADTNAVDLFKDRPIMKLLQSASNEPLAAHEEVALAMLLKSGTVDVNTTTPGSLDTPLHLAVRRRDALAVGMLLQSHANVNKRNAMDVTPLLLAAGQWRRPLRKVQEEMLQLLIDPQYGVHINAKRGSDGRTALHQAAAGGVDLAVEMLLEQGADPALQDDTRSNVLDLAILNFARMPLEAHGNVMEDIIDSMESSLLQDLKPGQCLFNQMMTCPGSRILENVLDCTQQGTSMSLPEPRPNLGFWAIACARMDILQLLLKRGLNSTQRNIRGENLIEYAQKYKSDLALRVKEKLEQCTN